ncbi:MAG: manganese efflux pump MntP [Anaerolineaceae bacterium]
MDSITIFLIALGLAMDCFAVALGIGCSPTPKDFRTYFRIAFHFGLFQGGMTFLGWLGGSTIAHLISNFDHWIAFGLLAFVGARMIRESLSKNEEEDPCNPSRGKTLIMLSVATSIDALAVGLSLALVEGSILVSSLVIGFTSLLLSVLGLFIGGRLGCKFGKRMELIGGLVLIGIGFRVLLSHLLG